MGKIVYLEITSWAGMSIGAEHYYGKLISHNNAGYEKDFGIKTVEIYKIMNEREANYLNEKDDWHCYKEGNKTERFENKQDIINIAISVWKKEYPECDLLILGRSAVADPQLCLDGPEQLKIIINQLYDRAEKIGYYDGGHYKEMDKIFNEFNELTKEFQ